MRDYPPSDFAVAFDIRHATVEGGLAWPVHFNLMTPHLGAVYVKDFAWEGGKPKNVPLGKGQVDPRFFGMLRKMAYAGPISVHVEYLENEGNPPNVEALRTDVATLRKLMGGA
jgi:sugar phosphate isomerase/epimerase